MCVIFWPNGKHFLSVHYLVKKGKKKKNGLKQLQAIWQAKFDQP